MRRPALLAATGLAALAALAIPSSALATHGGSDCTYATAEDVNTGAVSTIVVVYADALGGDGGMTDQAEVAAGACANTGLGTFEGGTVEVGAGDDGMAGDGPLDAYVVIDGDNENQDPSGQSDGYIGLSNWETSGARDANCTADGPDQGTPGSSNSGGCVGIDGGPWVDLSGVPVPTPMCGNTSGNTWDGSGGVGAHQRDGCSVP